MESKYVMIDLLKPGHTTQETKEFIASKLQAAFDSHQYALDKLRQADAKLSAGRFSKDEIRIACVLEDEAMMFVDVEMDAVERVLIEAQFTDDQLAVILKNCTDEQQERLLAAIEQSKLDKLIDNENGDEDAFSF